MSDGRRTINIGPATAGPAVPAPAPMHKNLAKIGPNKESAPVYQPTEWARNKIVKVN